MIPHPELMGGLNEELMINKFLELSDSNQDGVIEREEMNSFMDKWTDMLIE